MYGLIGRTLGHSYSADIHRVFGRYDYELKSLEPEELEGFIRGGGWQGLNVTIPYKQAVMPFLDEISPEAARIGCVNTIVRRDGKLVGHNTDYAGFLALADAMGVDFAEKSVMILGTGATSRTVSAAVRDRGAEGVTFVSRDPGPGAISYADAEKEDPEILINTTPVGMYPNVSGRPIDLSGFARLEAVIDVIYNPVRTPLVQQAEEMGVNASGALRMLVKQAAESCRLWTGEMPENLAEDVFERLRASRINILLTGMPGSGKSHVARELGSLMGRPVVDTDAEIKKEYGMPIPEVFNRFGEGHFRDTETRVLERVCREGGQIISTGGGAPLRPENRVLMRCNSRVVWLVRDLDRLTRRGRPLSQGTDLEKMWQARQGTYEAVSDAMIDNNSSVSECVARIREEFNENTGN